MPSAWLFTACNHFGNSLLVRLCEFLDWNWMNTLMNDGEILVMSSLDRYIWFDDYRLEDKLEYSHTKVLCLFKFAILGELFISLISCIFQIICESFEILREKVGVLKANLRASENRGEFSKKFHNFRDFWRGFGTFGKVSKFLESFPNPWRIF